MSSVPSWFASAACLAVGTYNWHPCCLRGGAADGPPHRGRQRGAHSHTHRGGGMGLLARSEPVGVPSLGRVVLATDPMESYHPGSIE